MTPTWKRCRHALRLGAPLLVTLLVCSPRAWAAVALHLFAAGSLSGAMTDLLAASGIPAPDIAAPVFGPSGFLRERIEHGAPADILASADMEQPRRLSHERGARPVVMFTRNRMCLLARESLGVTAENMLDRMLDPKLRLATSTPPALTVGPAYGMIVLTDNPLADRFAVSVMSEQGQAILAHDGFVPVAIP